MSVDIHTFLTKVFDLIKNKGALSSFITLYTDTYKEYPALNLIEQFKELVGIENPENPEEFEHSYDIYDDYDSYDSSYESSYDEEDE